MTAEPMRPSDWPSSFFQAAAPCRRSYPGDAHEFSTDPKSRNYRTCARCFHVRPPVLESITCHPFDRPALNAQLPTARVFGEPLPDGTLILESISVQLGTLRLRIEGHDMDVTLGRMPTPRWVRVDPCTFRPVEPL